MTGAKRKPARSEGAPSQPSDFITFWRDMDYAKYSMAFNSYLEAIIGNKQEDDRPRVRAWYVRYSWGNHRQFVAKYVKIGRTSKLVPATGADCATDLGISKQRVSAATVEMKQFGELESKGRVIVLNRSPVPKPQPKLRIVEPPDDFSGDDEEDDAPPPRPSVSRLTMARFDSDIWVRIYKKDAERRVEVEPFHLEYLRLDQLRISKFRDWVRTESNGENKAKQNSASPATVVNGPEEQRSMDQATSERPIYKGTRAPAHAVNKPSQQSSTSPAEATKQTGSVGQSSSEETDRLTDSEYALRLIREAIPEDLLKHLQDVPTRNMLQQIHKHLRGAPPELFTKKIHAKWAKITGLGFLINLAMEVGSAWTLPEPKRAEAEKMDAAEMETYWRDKWRNSSAEERADLEQLLPQINFKTKGAA